MIKTFGEFLEPDDEAQEYLVLNFSPSSIPLQQRWRNNGLSADFLADYISTFLPSEDEEDINKKLEVKDAISYIANELLENAMKYSHAPTQHSVNFSLLLDPDEVRFYVTNHIDESTAEEFQTFIETLLTSDPDELYVQQLEANMDLEDDFDDFEDEADLDETDDEATFDFSSSGLGYLSMVNDYSAKLSWKFIPNPEEQDMIIVTTLVRVAAH